MDAGDLLKTMLPMAVTLEIMRLKGAPWEKIQDMAQGHAQFIAEHGDNLLFLGPKKGDTSKAFTKFVQGVAALSFVPGGVTIFGQHYEATHPDSLTGPNGRWLYHSTFSGNLPQIARDGLVPTEPGQESVYRKLYFTGIMSDAVRHIEWAFGEHNFESAGDPVLLRTHSAHLPDVQEAESVCDDWYVEETVPAVFIQVWVPEKQAWIEVREAVKQGYFVVDQPQYGTTPDEFTRYIQETWPKS
jgi:hypothetical protein